MLSRMTNPTVRKILWVLAIILGALSLCLMVGRALVFSVALNKTNLEQLIQNEGFQKVRIDNVVGVWHLFDPVFTLSGVQTGADENALVRLRSVRLKVDSIKSLLQGYLVFSEIELIGVRLTLVVDEEGPRVKGLLNPVQEVNLDWLFETASRLDKVFLSDVDLRLEGYQKQLRIRSRQGEPWEITSDGNDKSVSFPIYIIRDGDVEKGDYRLYIAGNYKGHVREEDFEANLYLKVPSLSLTNFVSEIRLLNQNLSSIGFSSEIWLDVKPGQVSIVGDLNVVEVMAHRESYSETLLDKGSVRFRYRGADFFDGAWAVPRVELSQGDFQFGLTDISGAIALDRSNWALAIEIPSLDLKQLSGFLRFAGDKRFVSEDLKHALDVLSPGGLIEDVVILRESSMNEPVLSGRLVDFEMSPYQGLPSVKSLNGLFRVKPSGGYLDIETDNFVMDFPNIFEESWPFDSGRGRVSYEIVDGFFKLESGLIELSHGDLQAFGKITLNLPEAKISQEWGLLIGVKNSELLASKKFIPKALPEGLVNWLETSVLQGRSKLTGLSFHGALFGGSPKVRKTHDLFFKIEDLQVNFHPDWPDIQNAAGTLHADSYFVSSHDLTGQIYDTFLSKAQINVPLDLDGRADTIFVQAEASGGALDLIRVLNETTLAQSTANVAATWKAQGSLETELALNVPIGERLGEDLLVNVVGAFDSVEFQMPEFDLLFNDLTGVAHFSSIHGLSATGFTGRAFDKPFIGNISTVTEDSGDEIRIAIDGVISAASLYDWSDQLLLSRAAGEMTYRTLVHVPYGDFSRTAYVEINSDLSGLTLGLPYPLNKSNSEEKRQFQYLQYFGDDSNRVDVTIGDNILASLRIENEIVVGGLVQFGRDRLQQAEYDSVRITGRLNYLDVGRWIETIDGLGDLTKVSLNEEIATSLNSARLQIDKLFVYEFELLNTYARLLRSDEAWFATLENAMLKGDVTVADSYDRPIKIRLDRLNLETSGEADNFLDDINLSEVPAINFSTDLLKINGENYGSWGFDFRMEDEVAIFEELEASVAGLRILPSSILEWKVSDALDLSRIAADIEIDDLAVTMSEFGFASSIEGRDFKISTDFSWLGSPAEIDFESLTGQVDIRKGKGRFVQAETGGALKLLGIFDFASIARRLRLDFSDVLDKGFEFSEITGATKLNDGQISILEPIVIQGSAGKFTLGGEIDLITEELDNEMIVTLPVTKTLPWIAAYSAIAAGPLSGVGVMLAKVPSLEKKIEQYSSAKYRISGTIDEPEIEFVSFFDDKVAKASNEKSEKQR